LGEKVSPRKDVRRVQTESKGIGSDEEDRSRDKKRGK
jgi:hypothetical protein